MDTGYGVIERLQQLFFLGMIALIAACSSVPHTSSKSQLDTVDFNRVAAIAKIEERFAEDQAWLERYMQLSERSKLGQATHDEVEALKAQRPQFADLKTDALRIVDADPTDDAAFKAIEVALRINSAEAKKVPVWEGSSNQALQDRLVHLLLEHHLQRENFLSAMYLHFPSAEDGISFWTQVFATSPHRSVRSEAGWTLMRRYTFWSEKINTPPAKREELRQKVRYYGGVLREQYADIDSLSKKIPSVEALLTALDYSAGAALPDIEVATLAGGTDALAHYRGKWVLLDFWATWCAPCIKSQPELQALKQQMAGQPFEIIGISADTTPELAVQHLASTDLPWPQWYVGPKGKLLKSWGISSYPTYLLVDTKGRVYARGGASVLDGLKQLIPKLMARGAG